jgi:ribonuclease HI
MAGGSELIIYTDGACIPNPGRGGWGIIVVQPTGELHKFSGNAEEKTTSSRMEMTAVLMALRKLSTSGVPVVIRIDSEFVVRTLNGEYRQRKNKDLWTEINRELSRLQTRSIRYEWVKGHADDPYNAMADELANAAASNGTKLETPRPELPRRSAYDPDHNPFRITAPVDPALDRATNWRRKFRRPKD